MAANGKKVAVVGLPGVGKTTYLAALWDVVSTGAVPGSLVLDRLEGDKHHLNEIRDRWADCEEIERTKMSNEMLISMLLKDTASGAINEIVFSDMSGESFEQQWNERICTDEYRDLIRGMDGLLLIVHPRNVKQSILIRDANKALGQFDVTKEGNIRAGNLPKQVANALPTLPQYASTQVKLVELLQFIRLMRSPQSAAVRLAIVISAWDILEKMPVRMRPRSPQAWMEKHLPLLHQFIAANDNYLSSEIFGVSAQGGDLTEAAALRQHSSPSDRIVVLHGDSRTHDITLPVRWILA